MEKMYAKSVGKTPYSKQDTRSENVLGRSARMLKGLTFESGKKGTLMDYKTCVFNAI
jgi:hypothetical protein